MSKLSLEAPSTAELTAAKPHSEIKITYRPITRDDVVQMSQPVSYTHLTLPTICSV